ncbi:MAG: FAD-binding oxidoreductase [Terriglobia bacterium]
MTAEAQTKAKTKVQTGLDQWAAAGAAGENGFVTDAVACAAYAVDGLAPRGVLYPRSAEGAAQALKHAVEQGLAVIPCRNTTKLQTGNIPRRYDVALCLKEMNAVWHYEPADLTASVEPGMKLGDFQRMLARHGLWIPLDPPGGAKSSLGGIVAANAAGPLRLKYGAPRDFVLGMKIATTAGKIVKTGSRVVKNVAGYDLSRLLTGSYGTLGVIVEISFKLFPLPAARSSWRAAVSSLDAAREFRRMILDSPLGPMRMVLLDGPAAAIASEDLRQSLGWEIWLEFCGSERVLQRSAGLLGELAHAAGISFHALETEAAEAGWNRITDFAPTLARDGGLPIVLKAALPIAASEEFVRLAAAEAEKVGARHACFCQNGVGIVYACLMPERLSPELTASMSNLRQAAMERGGAMVIERCPIELKRDVDVWGPSGSDFDLMRKLKEVWDPTGTLSPGRFVGGL